MAPRLPAGAVGEHRKRAGGARVLQRPEHVRELKSSPGHRQGSPRHSATACGSRRRPRYKRLISAHRSTPTARPHRSVASPKRRSRTDRTRTGPPCGWLTSEPSHVGRRSGGAHNGRRRERFHQIRVMSSHQARRDPVVMPTKQVAASNSADEPPPPRARTSRSKRRSVRRSPGSTGSGGGRRGRLYEGHRARAEAIARTGPDRPVLSSPLPGPAHDDRAERRGVGVRITDRGLRHQHLKFVPSTTALSARTRSGPPRRDGGIEPGAPPDSGAGGSRSADVAGTWCGPRCVATQ
jgi:hypothetical protein